jgi:maleate isomerase
MRRLGVIVPASNTTVESEFSGAFRSGEVSVHYSRVHLKDVTVEGLEQMERGLADAAALLSDAKVDAVLFACTSGSLVQGLGYDMALAKEISDAAKCPAFTTSTAVVEALNALGAKNICLATPYVSEVEHREVQFLQSSGFNVLSAESLGYSDNLEIGKLTAQNAAAIARKVYRSGAEAVFVSCTNLQTFAALQTLEKEFSLPLVSSNSASLWMACRTLKTQPAASYGRLFNV